MELWERSEPLARLDALLRGSGTAGRVALVAGEAGIGKSSLVAAFTGRCGGRLLIGACDPLVTPRALGPLHDIGRQAGGRLRECLDTGGDVLGALVDELSGPRPHRRTVVVVEDAHWADGATLDLLVFLARRIERLAALLVVTYRDDEVGPEHPLRAALAAMPRHVVHRIPVVPLSPACVADRAARVGRDGAEVYRLTGGNPLLVTEVLAGDGGDAVRDLVLARIAGLPAPARDLARLVAVIPTRADAAVVRAYPGEVERCLAAGVLVVSGDGVAYRHELLRRTVEDALTPVTRNALHRTALRLLADLDGTDPARLAHHARAAGDTDAVLRYGTVAAAGAAAQGAHREAAAHYRAVIPSVAGLPARDRAELLEAAAIQAYLAGVAADGLDAGRAALREWESLGDTGRAGGCLRWISRLAWWSGRGAEARAAAAASVRVLSSGPPGRAYAMAVSNLAQLHMLAHELDAARDTGGRARRLADGLGDTETALHARINVATARMLSGDAGAASELLDLHRAAADAGLADHAARALVNRASSFLETSSYGAGAAALESALAYAESADLDGYVQYLLGLRATVRLEQLDWAGALADAQASLDRPTRLGVAVVPALVARGRILSARGDDTAPALLDAAARHAYGLEEVQWIGPVASARAEHVRMTEPLSRAGSPSPAWKEARPAWELATAKGHRWYAAELALFRGDPADGAVTAARSGRRYAHTWALAYGDRAAVTEALATLDGLGAVRAAAHVRAAARHRGVTGVPRGPRPATTAHAAGLTTRQAEVLRLLVSGLSNADIAARLTLSARTVEHHISAVLGKLGVTSRAQAIAVTHERRLLPNMGDLTHDP